VIGRCAAAVTGRLGGRLSHGRSMCRNWATRFTRSRPIFFSIGRFPRR
jgi:hypothetical protein